MATRQRPTQPPVISPQRSPSNTLLLLANSLTLLFSIPVLVVGIWLATRHHADCFSFLQRPLIVIGAAMIVVSVFGLLAALTRQASLLWLYLYASLLLILLLLALTIFAFAVTRGSNGHPVAGGKFKEYRLNDYRPWLRNRMNDPRIWFRIKSCLRDDHVCNDMNIDYQTVNELYRAKLPYVESGCCKPPTSCGFKFMNATNWIEPTNSGADVDCSRWSNNPSQLCYDCNSCRAAVIRNLKKDWGKVAKVTISMLAVLVLLYAVAWFAFLNSLTEKSLYPTSYQAGVRQPV